MPGGRPPIYSDEIITKTREYLESCGVEEDTFEKFTSDSPKSSSVGHDRVLRVKLPSIEGLAVHLRISRETIRVWAKEKNEDGTLKYPEFSGIIEELMAKQAEMLTNRGISGDFNPTITKLLLTKHGYRDNLALSDPDGGPVQVVPITGMKIVKE